MELDREQVIKDLQEVVDNYSGSWKRYDVLANALALIKELTEENERLEVRLIEQSTENIMLLMKQKRVKADAVRNIHKMIEEEINITIEAFDFNISECDAIRQILRGVKNDIYRIAKKMLEEEDDE